MGVYVEATLVSDQETVIGWRYLLISVPTHRLSFFTLPNLVFVALSFPLSLFVVAVAALVCLPF